MSARSEENGKNEGVRKEGGGTDRCRGAPLSRAGQQGRFTSEKHESKCSECSGIRFWPSLGDQRRVSAVSTEDRITIMCLLVIQAEYHRDGLIGSGFAEG